VLEQWFGMLEQGGWLVNTLVIVTSDHGESLGERGGRLRRHGGFNNEGLQVPLIVFPAPLPIEETPEARAQLEALGYAGEEER
jgi:arylsulfatase A-like enzyme